MRHIHKYLRGDQQDTGIAIFTQSENSFEDATLKLQSRLYEYNKFHDERREWFLKRMENTPLKGDKDALVRRLHYLDLAMEIYKESTEFMHKFNAIVQENKEDLYGNSHPKIALVLKELSDLPREDLISDNGRLKRQKSWYKKDTPIIRGARGNVQMIKDIYILIEKSGKCLGKSQAQIEGMIKQSSTMRMRWGSF